MLTLFVDRSLGARIAYRTLERLAVAEAGVKMFLFAAGDATGPAMAGGFVKARTAIHRTADEQPAPFIAKVYKDGSVRIWRRGPELAGL